MLHAVVAFLLGFVAIPVIEGSFSLSEGPSVTGPALDVDVTFDVTGSHIEAGKQWSYRVCCFGTCPALSQAATGPNVHNGVRDASVTHVEISAACDYTDPGDYTATLHIGGGVTHERTYTDTISIIAGGDTFDNYTVADTAQEIKDALQNPAIQGVYIKAGDYSIDSPVVINRNTPLHVYGGGMGTILRALNENVPEFLVTSCSLVRVARVSMFPINSAWVNEDSIVQNTGSDDCDIELSSASLTRVRMLGAGELISENVRYGTQGKSDAAVLLDHPLAVAHIIGGDITSNGMSDGTGNQWHVWVKRGRVGIWGLSVEGQPGIADFRFDDSEAGALPHYVVGVRSEGAHPPFNSGPSAFADVRGDAQVVLMGNSSAWSSPELENTLVVAPVATTAKVWLIGNSCAYSGQCKRAVTGTTAQMRMIAIGNLLWAGSDPTTVPPFPTMAALSRAHNLYYDTSGVMQAFDPTNDVQGFELPPLVRAPTALLHPKMTEAAAAAFGWKNVRLDYAAIGDGIADDTEEIQAALNSGCVTDGTQNNKANPVFFPPGNYKVTNKLTFNVSGQPCFGDYVSSTSLLMAGADAATTRIFRTTPGGIFEMQGGRFPWIQDINFDLVDANVTDGTLVTGSAAYAGIAIDFMLGSNVVEYGGLLHRVKVSGGDAAVIWGHTAAPAGNGSENMCSYCELSNAGVCWASGHANAINNILWNSTIKDCEYGIKQGYAFIDDLTGWSTAKGATGFHVVQENIRVATQDQVGNPYAYVASDFAGGSPRFYPGVPNAGTSPHIQLLHDSNLAVSPQALNSEWIRTHRGPQGIVLVDSVVTGGDVRIEAGGGSYPGDRFLVALRGSFSRWAEVFLGPDSTKSDTPQ